LFGPGPPPPPPPPTLGRPWAPAIPRPRRGCGFRHGSSHFWTSLPPHGRAYPRIAPFDPTVKQRPAGTTRPALYTKHSGRWLPKVGWGALTQAGPSAAAEANAARAGRPFIHHHHHASLTRAAPPFNLLRASGPTVLEHELITPIPPQASVVPFSPPAASAPGLPHQPPTPPLNATARPSPMQAKAAGLTSCSPSSSRPGPCPGCPSASPP
jgi:hypothetical protein